MGHVVLRRLCGAKGCVEICVADDGPGIERRYRKRIFGRFYRIPATMDANISGVGLGLALCRHVVKAHGGTIGVRSEVGKGSKFWIRLPAERG